MLFCSSVSFSEKIPSHHTYLSDIFLGKILLEKVKKNYNPRPHLKLTSLRRKSMFALCARHATRTTASTLSRPRPSQPSDRTRGRLYSDWTRTEFPKESRVFSEKTVLLLNPPSRKSVEEEVGESYGHFCKVISGLQKIVGPLDPKTRATCWKLVVKHSIACKTEERSLEDEADSKTGKKLKDLLRTELTKIEAFSMTAELFDDAIRGFFSPDTPLAISRASKQMTDEELQICLAQWDCSLEEISKGSEEALRTAFRSVLEELQKTTHPLPDEEIVWKTVFDARLKPLRDRIIFSMTKIEGIEQKTDAGLRELVREKFRIELFLKNEIKGDLRRDICQLWDVPEDPSPRAAVLRLFGIAAE